MYNNLRDEYLVAGINPNDTNAQVQGAVDRVNANYAMDANFDTSGADNVLTVSANSELNPYSLEVDHSKEGDLPEFTVYADSTNPYGSAQAETDFNDLGVAVAYDDADQTWTITFPKDIGGVSTTDIEFYLAFTAVNASGDKYGSMYNQGYLTE